MNPQINWLVLVNSMIGLFISGLSSRIFLIALPTVAIGLETDMLGVSWALIAYQVSGIGLGVILGRLGDIFSRQRMYGLGVAIMTAGSFLCGISRNVLQLTLFRFLQGVAGSLIQSSGRSLGLEAVPAGSEGRAQGLMVMSHQFGFLLGPPLGGFIIELAGWRWAFFCVVPIGVAGIALTSALGRGRPETDRTGPRQPVDYKGAALFFVIALMAALLLDQKTAELHRMVNKGFLAIGFIGLLWWFIRHELRTKSPILDLSIFKHRTFAFGAVGLLGVCIIQGLGHFVMPFYLQDVLFLSPSFIGLLFLIPSILNLIVAPMSGQLRDKIGARVPLVIGVLFSLTGLSIGARFGVQSPWLLPASVLALSGMATAFFNPPVQATMIAALPRNQWGIGTGIIHSIFGLGHLLGISLTGLVLTLAFRHYSGVPGTEPGPQNPIAFVASINIVFMAAIAIAFICLFTSFNTTREPAKAHTP